MSRSNNVRVQDPAAKIITWSGEKGIFKVYDRSQENPKKEDLPLPISFIVLDMFQQVTGYSEKLNCGLRSNMCRDMTKANFTVRSKSDNAVFPITGYWKDICEKIDHYGGRWTKVIYAMMKSKSGYEIVRIELSGAAVSAFINHVKDPYKGAIVVKSYAEGQKGKVTYKFPVFNQMPISEELEEKAKIADAELQKWVESYFNRDHEPEPENETTNQYPVKPEEAFIPESMPTPPPQKESDTDIDSMIPTDDLPF